MALTISQVVEQLQALQIKHGDLPVMILTYGDEGEFMRAPVTQVYLVERAQPYIVIEGTEE